MKPKSLKIDAWYHHLDYLFDDPRMDTLVKAELKRIHPHYSPSIENIFNCMNYFEFSNTRIVFVFLSPYKQSQNGVKFATGLATGTPGVDFKTPTLNVMLDALGEYLDDPIPDFTFNYTLEHLAKQGILLLNTALTVPTREGDARSHIQVWNWFTGGVIQELSQSLSGLIFVFFGNDAKELKKYVSHPANHHIIDSCHPVATHYRLQVNGFDYSKIPDALNFKKYYVFQKVDKILFKLNKEKIQWLR